MGREILRMQEPSFERIDNSARRGGLTSALSVGQREFHPDQSWNSFVVRTLQSQMRDLEMKKNRLVAAEFAWQRKKPLCEKRIHVFTIRSSAYARKLPKYADTKLHLHARELKAKWEKGEASARIFAANRARIANLEATAAKEIKRANEVLKSQEKRMKKAERRQEKIRDIQNGIREIEGKLWPYSH